MTDILETPDEKYVEHLSEHELTEELTRLLHTVWGESKLSPEYNKKHWLRLHTCIEKSNNLLRKKVRTK